MVRRAKSAEDRHFCLSEKTSSLDRQECPSSCVLRRPTPCKEHDPSQALEALRRVGVLDPEVRGGRHGPEGERVAHGARRVARPTWLMTARAPIRRGLAGNRKNPICRGGGRHLLVPRGAVRRDPSMVPGDLTTDGRMCTKRKVDLMP
jgi:hypothetical protein